MSMLKMVYNNIPRVSFKFVLKLCASSDFVFLPFYMPTNKLNTNS